MHASSCSRLIAALSCRCCAVSLSILQNTDYSPNYKGNDSKTS
jgi:hypothetical protein